MADSEKSREHRANTFVLARTLDPKRAENSTKPQLNLRAVNDPSRPRHSKHKSNQNITGKETKKLPKKSAAMTTRSLREKLVMVNELNCLVVQAPHQRIELLTFTRRNMSSCSFLYEVGRKDTRVGRKR